MPQHPKTDDDCRDLEKRIAAQLRAIWRDIQNAENPFEPPPDRLPPGAPGQRRVYWSEEEPLKRTGS